MAAACDDHFWDDDESRGFRDDKTERGLWRSRCDASHTTVGEGTVDNRLDPPVVLESTVQQRRQMSPTRLREVEAGRARTKLMAHEDLLALGYGRSFNDSETRALKSTSD
jgi:hypothetical protein